MLKINQIYLYGDKTYIAILDRTKKNNRYVYTARKVKASGHLGVEFKIFYSKNKFTPVKAKIELFVELPKNDKDRIRYENVVDSTLLVVAQYKKLKKNDPKRVLLQREIGHLAFASTSIYHVKKGRFYDLRDFAKAIGFKRYKTLYSWVAAYLKKEFVEDKYKFIKETATKTIRTCIKNYQKNWKALTGFDKEIDKLIKRDFLEYSKELNRRGEVLWE